MTVPLTHDGRVVGVLSCYSAAMPGFTEDHLRLLELAAASLGSALAAVEHSGRGAAAGRQRRRRRDVLRSGPSRSLSARPRSRPDGTDGTRDSGLRIPIRD